MKKGIAYAFLALGVGVGFYATRLIMKKINDAIIDSKTVSVDEALEILKKSR